MDMEPPSNPPYLLSIQRPSAQGEFSAFIDLSQYFITAPWRYTLTYRSDTELQDCALAMPFQPIMVLCLPRKCAVALYLDAMPWRFHRASSSTGAGLSTP